MDIHDNVDLVFIYDNFFPCKIIYDDIEFPTVQHAFQAYKVKDKEIRQKIAEIKDPVELDKYLWTLPTPPYSSLIPSVKDYEVMKSLLKQKFSDMKYMSILLSSIVQNDKFNIYLIDQEKYYGELNTCSTKFNATFWYGSNYITKVLLEIRNEHRLLESLKTELLNFIFIDSLRDI